MESLVRKETNDAIDALEVAMLKRFQRIECPLNHSFGDGLYVREIFMPKGSRVTSKIHKKRHPYFLMKGEVNVWIEGKWELIKAPHFGWTELGTRRVLKIVEDAFWVTVHDNPGDGQDLGEIEERLIETHNNIFLQQNESE